MLNESGHYVHENAVFAIMDGDGWDKFVNWGIALTLIWFLRDAIMSIAGG